MRGRGIGLKPKLGFRLTVPKAKISSPLRFHQASLTSWVRTVSSPSRLYYPELLSTVLKSSGSAFTNFVRDEFTTLIEVDDRIFSTSIDLTYTFPTFPISPEFFESDTAGAQEKGAGTPWDGETVAGSARKITLELFATDDSASVQVRLPDDIHHSVLHCMRS